MVTDDIPSLVYRQASTVADCGMYTAGGTLGRMGFGHRLRAAYIAKFGNRADFAKALGKQYHQVSKWDGGKDPDAAVMPDRANLLLIAKTLEMSVDELLGSEREQLDPSTADLVPFSTEEIMNEAARLAGLSPAGTAQLKSVRYRGVPMTLEALTRMAKAWRAAELEAEALGAPAHPKVEEKGQKVETPIRDGARRLKR